MAATTVERVERILEKLEDDGLVHVERGTSSSPICRRSGGRSTTWGSVTRARRKARVRRLVPVVRPPRARARRCAHERFVRHQLKEPLHDEFFLR